jgi:hypothetical protein
MQHPRPAKDNPGKVDFSKRRLGHYLIAYSVWFLMIFLFTKGLQEPREWLGSWFKWDAQWYERIWREGYRAADPRALVFPPGYSIIVGGLSSWTPMSFGLSALILNLLAFLASLIFCAELFFFLFGISPLPIFVLALTSPASYSAFVPYSDSIFSLLLWGSIFVAVKYQGQRKALLMEFILLMAAPWIRLTGYSFASWFLFRKISAIAVMVSLAGWFLLNHLIAGDALYFLHAQELFLMPKGNFFDGLIQTFRGICHLPGVGAESAIRDYLQFYFLPLLYLMSIAASSIWLFLRKQPLIAVTVLSILIMSHNQSFWRSVVRYDLPLLPCIYGMLFFFLKGKNRPLLVRVGIPALIGILQFGLQIYFANLFKAGLWAF